MWVRAEGEDWELEGKVPVPPSLLPSTKITRATFDAFIKLIYYLCPLCITTPLGKYLLADLIFLILLILSLF
jgi:ABC-type polysaccharide/polyol phosphate export permease